MIGLVDASDICIVVIFSLSYCTGWYFVAQLLLQYCYCSQNTSYISKLHV